VNLAGGDIDYSKGIIPRWDMFSIIYLSFIVAALLFPLLIKKEISFLIKVNSLGVYFAIILIIFMIYSGIKSLCNTSYDFQVKENVDGDNTKHILLFGPNPFKLAGSLTLGFYSHSVIFSILKNNKNQENNVKDLFNGYVLTGMTYIITGIMGYIGFSGKDFHSQFEDVRRF